MLKKSHLSECWSFQDLEGFKMSVILLIPPIESTEVSLKVAVTVDDQHDHKSTNLWCKLWFYRHIQKETP